MQFIIEIIRKVVILVLLMEVVLQLQSGKQYEPYIKLLIGIMVVYSLVSGIFGVWDKVEDVVLAPMQEFRWTGSWYLDFTKEAEEKVEKSMENQKIQEGWEQTDGKEGLDNIDVQVEITPIGEISVEKIPDISG